MVYHAPPVDIVGVFLEFVWAPLRAGWNMSSELHQMSLCQTCVADTIFHKKFTKYK